MRSSYSQREGWGGEEGCRALDMNPGFTVVSLAFQRTELSYYPCSHGYGPSGEVAVGEGMFNDNAITEVGSHSFLILPSPIPAQKRVKYPLHAHAQPGLSLGPSESVMRVPGSNSLSPCVALV